MKKKEESKEIQSFKPTINKQSDFNNDVFFNMEIERRDKVDQTSTSYNGASFPSQVYPGYNRVQYDRPFDNYKVESDFRSKNCEYPYMNGGFAFGNNKYTNDSKNGLFQISKQTKKVNHGLYDDQFEYEDPNIYEPVKGKKRGRKRKTRPLE